VRTREDIFVMARTRPDDGRKQRVLFSKRLAVAAQSQFAAASATLDDIVFLPANLSRLVIDPYRDACSVGASLGSVELGLPLVVSGFDDAPEEIRRAAAHGARSLGLASIGRRRLGDGVPWFQLCVQGKDTSDADAEGVIAVSLDGAPSLPLRSREGQLLGLAAPAARLRDALPRALDGGLDLIVLEGSPLLGRWPELAAAPDLTAIRDAIAVLRELNREEDVALLWHGGIRSGTDLAKLMALRASAVSVGLSLALAVGGAIQGDDLTFSGGLDQASRDEQAALFLQALRAEASIMPRCTGKTDIRNLEPEDLRAITIVTADATGIPLAGRNEALR
jgi:hypothetical protein